MKIVKIVLLITAAITVILRLFSYENAAFITPETLKLMNIISIVSACICVISAVIWMISVKKSEKAEKEKNKSSDI